MELDPLGDMFGDGEKKPAAAAGETSQLPTFYIDESDSAKKEGNGEEKVDEQTVKEEATTPGTTQQQTSRFWSWWSRSKSEAGSKENILEEGEKKPAEEGERQENPPDRMPFYVMNTWMRGGFYVRFRTILRRGTCCRYYQFTQLNTN